MPKILQCYVFFWWEPCIVEMNILIGTILLSSLVLVSSLKIYHLSSFYASSWNLNIPTQLGFSIRVFVQFSACTTNESIVLLYQPTVLCSVFWTYSFIGWDLVSITARLSRTDAGFLVGHCIWLFFGGFIQSSCGVAVQLAALNQIEISLSWEVIWRYLVVGSVQNFVPSLEWRCVCVCVGGG